MSCGGVGAVLFTATYLIEGFTRPGYVAWQQAIAALSLGPGGWVQQVNFIVYGVLLVLSAVGWYRFLMPGRGAIWFPLFQGISGLCLIGIGVLSVLTPLHTILAWVLILTLAAGCFAFAQYALNAHCAWVVRVLADYGPAHPDFLGVVRVRNLSVWYRLLGWRSACQPGVTPSGYVCL